jgi:hypothetical protein
MPAKLFHSKWIHNILSRRGRQRGPPRRQALSLERLEARELLSVCQGTPAVSIQATQNASESPQTDGVFAVRTKHLDNGVYVECTPIGNLTVKFETAGTAYPGPDIPQFDLYQDFEVPQPVTYDPETRRGSGTIPDTLSMVEVMISPVNDDHYEGSVPETVSVALLPDTGYTRDMNSFTATVSITDVPLPEMPAALAA